MLFYEWARAAVVTILVVLAAIFVVLAACSGPVKIEMQKCVPVGVTVPPSPAPGASPYCVG